jgi:hypothetical protein
MVIFWLIVGVPVALLLWVTLKAYIDERIEAKLGMLCPQCGAKIDRWAKFPHPVLANGYTPHFYCPNDHVTIGDPQPPLRGESPMDRLGGLSP